MLTRAHARARTHTHGPGCSVDRRPRSSASWARPAVRGGAAAGDTCTAGPLALPCGRAWCAGCSCGDRCTLGPLASRPELNGLPTSVSASGFAPSSSGFKGNSCHLEPHLLCRWAACLGVTWLSEGGEKQPSGGATTASCSRGQPACVITWGDLRRRQEPSHTLLSEAVSVCSLLVALVSCVCQTGPPVPSKHLNKKETFRQLSQVHSGLQVLCAARQQCVAGGGSVGLGLGLGLGWALPPGAQKASWPQLS